MIVPLKTVGLERMIDYRGVGLDYRVNLRLTEASANTGHAYILHVHNVYAVLTSLRYIRIYYRILRMYICAQREEGIHTYVHTYICT